MNPTLLEEPPVPPKVIAEHRASTAPFRERAVDWLRSVQHLSTTVVPSFKIEDAEGRARLEGALVTPNRSGTLGVLAMWLFAIGLVLAMLGLPGVDPGTRRLVNGLGYGFEALSAAVVGLAWLSWRRASTPIVVELRGEPSGSVTAGVVATAVDAARPRALWIVAQSGFDDAALAAAADHAVRCFVPAGRGFIEIGPATQDRARSSAKRAPSPD